eukprot:6173739-Pleurochrysis_carterae.AAC.2
MACGNLIIKYKEPMRHRLSNAQVHSQVFRAEHGLKRAHHSACQLPRVHARVSPQAGAAPIHQDNEGPAHVSRGQELFCGADPTSSNPLRGCCSSRTPQLGHLRLRLGSSAAIAAAIAVQQPDAQPANSHTICLPPSTQSTNTRLTPQDLHCSASHSTFKLPPPTLTRAGYFSILDQSLLRRAGGEPASRVDMLAIENGALRGEGDHGEVKLCEPVYDVLNSKRRKWHKFNVTIQVATAVRSIKSEVKVAETAMRKKRKERAALERRLRKAITEQNEIVTRLAESLRTARDR